MTITAPPTIPLITDPNTFATRSQDWVVWQAEQLYPFITDTGAVLGLSTSSTSVTSNSIGTGSKTFTVETGKGYVAGMSLSIAYTTTPTNRMFALVTSYNSGTGELIVNVQAVEGSGTYTAWSISASFNGVIGTGQLSDLGITNAKLAQQYINDLTTVTFDPLVDYVPIADGSDSGNKKKAFLNSIGQGNSTFTITDSGVGKSELIIDGTIITEETLASRKSTIDGGSTLYPEFKCRAWANWNGTGTPAFRGSGNFSSITDNGTGDWTLNLSTAMPDTNYAVVLTTRIESGVSGNVIGVTAYSTSSVRVQNENLSGLALIDSTFNNIAIFR